MTRLIPLLLCLCFLGLMIFTINERFKTDNKHRRILYLFEAYVYALLGTLSGIYAYILWR